MKVECGSCAARYAIQDEKIAGRVFKIRCKKCQSAIVVRGDRVEAPADGAEPSQAVWHVVVDGAQDGPFDRETLCAMREAGSIGDDAFVWREGWADWEAMSAVEELTPSGARHEGADLFAQSDASPFAGEDDVVASSPSARAERSLTGARNESSVLFSLSNLSLLSTGPTGAPASSRASTATASSTAPPRASTEGSGLIDIRALAASGMGGASTGSSTGSGIGFGSGPGPTASDDRVDALLAIGGANPLSALATPVLAPASAEPDRRPLLVVGLGLFAVLVVAVAAVTVVVLTRRPAPGPEVAMPEVTAPAMTEPEVTAPTAAAPPGAGPRATPEPARSEVREPDVEAVEADATRVSASTERAPRRARNHPPRETPAASPRPDTPPRGDRGDRSLTRLLETALDGDRETPTREASPPAPSLAPAPARSEVVAAMNRLSAPVRACGDGAHGNATVSFAFGSDGAVRSADVTAAELPPAVRSCVAREARTARVPPFAQNTFRVVFPFRL